MANKKFYETGFRLNKADRAALEDMGLYVYSRRDNGKESTIEPSVIVDFLGTLVTNFEIGFEEEGPNAYTIYDGDSYLKSVGAEQAYKLDELLA